MKTRKRIICAILATVLMLSLCACGGSDQEKVYEVPQEAAGFSSAEEVFALAAENHRIYTSPDSLESMNLDAYAINDKALLTQEELEALWTVRGYAGAISVEQAMEDVDLFFRTWKYAYPSYYFMGEELFTRARQQVETALASHKLTISGEKLGDILYEAMSFLQDCHSTINGISPADREDDLHYLCYCDVTQSFDRDEQGFYQTYEGVKWYFSSCARSEMRIEPLLLPSGKVAYGPLLLVPRSEEVTEDAMILQNGEEEKTVTIRWTLCADEPGTGDSRKQADVTASGDIFYIDYLDMHSELGDVNEFIQTGYEARDHKAVILDLRHTQGFGHWQFLEWLKAFTGEEPTINAAFLTRNNALHTVENYEGFKAVSLGGEDCSVWYKQGHESKNDIPFLILTDKSCGSSVEEACLHSCTLQNAILIGGNTAGCAQGGSVQTYYLPHSGVPFAVGGFMELEGKAENIDGVGYEPDIWCEPQHALQYALLFLRNYGLADEESITPLLEMAEPAANLVVHWMGVEIEPGWTFGDIGEDGNSIYVIVDEEAITDFTVTSAEPDIMSARKAKEDKNIVWLKKLESFEGEHIAFTITYRGKDYTFYGNDNTWVP